MIPTRLLRQPQVANLIGLRPTSIYMRVKAGLLPPPVRLTARSIAWPENEIAAINAAKIAGKSDEEIRELVTALVKARKQQVDAPGVAA